MPLRDWSAVDYLPLLGLKPAEMRALEELPNITKDLLLPVISLRPWVASHNLGNSLDRISEAYGSRPVVVAMSERDPLGDKPVHGQLDALRDPGAGFKNWCDFFGENQNYIPAIQFSPQVADEESQISTLFGLGRGIVVVIESFQFGLTSVVAQRIAKYAPNGQDVCVVLDLAQVNAKHLKATVAVAGLINAVRKFLPAAHVAVSASSFPDSFTGLKEQPIYERTLFETLEFDGLIYSDRGSARVERQVGGGGQPAPRIDYPLLDEWKFFRSDDVGNFPGYRQQALELMRAPCWDASFRVWGTQMIERTAAGDTSAIGSPQKATAARINLHLQRQAFYSAPQKAGDTDEDWSG
jgi:hypothetical protein